MPNHVVLFSGGVGSWAAAQRVSAAMDRSDSLTLLFTDTNTEDKDLYRFIAEAAASVPSAELITIADGRDVWEVFNDVGMIGNTRVDPCSRILKRDLARSWINENCDPNSDVVYLGIDWTEMHRYERAVPHWKPFTLKAPLTEPPLLSRLEMFHWLSEYGIQPPRLYALGFPHNNCGGFCVKAGHGQFANLLRTMPERFAYHEAKEQEFRDRTGKDVAVLRDRSGGATSPLTMRAFRERIEAGGEQLQLDDWGGCGCMLDG